MKSGHDEDWSFINSSLDCHWLKRLGELPGRVIRMTALRLKNTLMMDVFNGLTSNLGFANSWLWLQALDVLKQACNE